MRPGSDGDLRKCGSLTAARGGETTDRLLDVLSAGPKVVEFAQEGQTLRLFLSFRGCDDDAFEIEADLLSARFLYPKEPS